MTPDFREQRFPSALIIGVRKGGTRALLDALALHPTVRAVKRETHFFDANYTKGFEWYKSLMPLADSNQVRLVSYLETETSDSYREDSRLLYQSIGSQEDQEV